MSIWKHPVDIHTLNRRQANSMVGRIGIEFIEIGADYLSATMPVNDNTRQPFGILHGGASVALAETLGSTAGYLCIDLPRQRCVGLEINANHLRPVSDGLVTGTARPRHLGRRTQVWEIEIMDEQGRIICISRLTLAVMESKPSGDG